MQKGVKTGSSSWLSIGRRGERFGGVDMCRVGVIPGIYICFRKSRGTNVVQKAVVS